MISCDGDVVADETVDARRHRGLAMAAEISASSPSAQAWWWWPRHGHPNPRASAPTPAIPRRRRRPGTSIGTRSGGRDGVPRGGSECPILEGIRRGRGGAQDRRRASSSPLSQLPRPPPPGPEWRLSGSSVATAPARPKPPSSPRTWTTTKMNRPTQQSERCLLERSSTAPRAARERGE